MGSKSLGSPAGLQTLARLNGTDPVLAIQCDGSFRPLPSEYL